VLYKFTFFYFAFSVQQHSEQL